MPADVSLRDPQPGEVSPSTHDGLGAVLTGDGVSFRVWAPHAAAVWVTGTFNDWSDSAHPLAAEPEGGLWSREIAGVEPGDEYLYLIRARDQDGGELLRRIDPRARKVTNSVGNAVVYDADAFDWDGDDFTPPPREELVIYELHVGSFTDPESSEVGTFDSAIERLDYLVELGINAVEMMPAAEFAGDYSWGYNPAWPFAVESGYGGPDALKRFIKAAHAKGIAVLMDVVYNHLGPSDLALWRFDGWGEHGGGGIYFFNDHRRWTPWGDTRPDYGRREVRDYLRDNALMWVEEYHVDGLRFDMTLYIRGIRSAEENLPEGWSLTAEINEAVHAVGPPNFITIAEDLQSDPRLTRKPRHPGPAADGTDDGVGPHGPGTGSLGDWGAGFDAQWDAGFVHPVREVAMAARDEYRSVRMIVDSLLHAYDGDPFKRVVYTESHDEVANGKARLPSEIDGNSDPEGSGSFFARKQSCLAAGLMLTAPGIPMLFMGQAFLENGWFRDDVPLNWDRRGRFPGVFRLFRDLIALRRNTAGRTRGLTGPSVRVLHANDSEKLVTYHRWQDGGPDDDVLVVAHFRNESAGDYRIGLPVPGPWTLRLNSDLPDYGDDFGGHAAPETLTAEPVAYDGCPQSATISVGPYTLLVYSRAG